jgi:hypothetical protein
MKGPRVTIKRVQAAMLNCLKSCAVRDEEEALAMQVFLLCPYPPTCNKQELDEVVNLSTSTTGKVPSSGGCHEKVNEELPCF